MLTGARPIIWDWDGAAEIWGDKYVIRSLQDAKQAVLKDEPTKELPTELMNAMSSQDVLQHWQQVISNQS
jgi:hypothetical protein